MFETLKQLVGNLDESIDVAKYGDVRDNRKILQTIKNETQRLRVELMAKYKESKVKA